MTTTIIAATIIVTALIVLAVNLAKNEDEQIANIKRRLDELESGKKEG